MALSINSQIEINVASGLISTTDKELYSSYDSYFTMEMYPLYSSVEDVRRLAGAYIANIQDDTINQVILKYSVMADNMSPCATSYQNNPYYQQNRSYWVLVSSSLNILFNTEEYVKTGYGRSFKQLGDFSVSDGELPRSAASVGAHRFMSWLECEIYKYDYALMNCTTPLTNCLGLKDTEAAQKDYMPVPAGLTDRGALDMHKPIVGRRWVLSELDIPAGHNKTIIGGRKFSVNTPSGVNENSQTIRNPYGPKK